MTKTHKRILAILAAGGLLLPFLLFWLRHVLLIEACSLNIISLTRFALSIGADPNTRLDDAEAYTPVELGMDNREIVHILRRHGAKLDAPDGRGRTALMEAAHMADIEGIRTLIAEGANVNARDYDDHTPLWWVTNHTQDWFSRWPDDDHTHDAEMTEMLQAAGAKQ